MKLICIYEENEPSVSDESDFDIVARAVRQGQRKTLEISKPANLTGTASARSLWAYTHKAVLERQR